MKVPEATALLLAAREITEPLLEPELGSKVPTETSFERLGASKMGKRSPELIGAGALLVLISSRSHAPIVMTSASAVAPLSSLKWCLM